MNPAQKDNEYNPLNGKRFWGLIDYLLSLILNPLLSNKILDYSKLKAFADDKINVAKMMISLSDRVENIARKGENAGYQHFLLFPQCFQKTFFFRVVKSRDFVIKS